MRLIRLSLKKRQNSKTRVRYLEQCLPQVLSVLLKERQNKRQKNWKARLPLCKAKSIPRIRQLQNYKVHKVLVHPQQVAHQHPQAEAHLHPQEEAVLLLLPAEAALQHPQVEVVLLHPQAEAAHLHLQEEAALLLLPAEVAHLHPQVEAALLLLPAEAAPQHHQVEAVQPPHQVGALQRLLVEALPAVQEVVPEEELEAEVPAVVVVLKAPNLLSLRLNPLRK